MVGHSLYYFVIYIMKKNAHIFIQPGLKNLILTKINDSGIDEISLKRLEDGVSKVVDENGEPLLVFHGTNNEFNVFDFNKADIGFHFGTFTQAKNRLETKLFFNGSKSNISMFFLNIKSIYQVADIGYWEYPQRYLDMFMSDNIISESEFKKNGFQFLNYKEDNKKIRDFLIKKYNNTIGFEYNNKYEDKGKSYIVIHSNQIKLADGTNTTFDGSNPDIRFEGGGETDLDNINLTTYIVRFDTDEDSEIELLTTDFEDAKYRYDSTTKGDYTNGSFGVSLYKKVDTYKFVYELDEDESIEVYPIEEYYKDLYFYQLIY